ncbi:MAG TPA: DoxX family protein [Propionibacteriaceae bacterium]|nr:DoxX family protein [Propionibacteriaceae bacterium]
MSLIRAAGRTMLASFFVVNGFKSARKPDQFVADAEPIAQKVVPLVQKVAPPTVTNYIPEDTRSLVRYTGIAQVIGGLGLATGIGRRGCSALLAATMIPHVLASRTPAGATAEQRTASRSVALRNVALLGAVLIASRDTEGHPSLGWRAQREQERLSRAASQQRRHLKKQQKHARKALGKQTTSLGKSARRSVGHVADSLESALS